MLLGPYTSGISFKGRGLLFCILFVVLDNSFDDASSCSQIIRLSSLSPHFSVS